MTEDQKRILDYELRGLEGQRAMTFGDLGLYKVFRNLSFGIFIFLYFVMVWSAAKSILLFFPIMTLWIISLLAWLVWAQEVDTEKWRRKCFSKKY